MNNKELKIWNCFNNMLISVLAHDLRQPFSSIIMITDMLKFTGKSLSADEFYIIMDDLKDTASKSIELLDGLLYWIKSKKEGFEYKPQPLLLNDIINEANGLYTLDQQKKNLKLFNTVPERQVIYAHKQMLQFINRNILSNATKHSNRDGIIQVRCFVDGERITVAFSDQGEGIIKEKMQSIFSIEEKVKNENNGSNGAGIALSICYDMICQMKGTLWAESVPGNGTTFYYSLPHPDLL